MTLTPPNETSPPRSTNEEALPYNPEIDGPADQYEATFNERIPYAAWRNGRDWVLPKLKLALETGEPVPEFVGLPTGPSWNPGPAFKRK